MPLRWLGSVCAAGALLVGAGVLVVQDLQAGGAATPGSRVPLANQRPSPLPPAPSESVLTVPDPASPGGRAVCPTGSVPSIMLSGSRFSPAPKGGSEFAAGTYTVDLTGQINNETAEPLIVDGVHASVNGRAWHPAVHAPHTVPPHSSAPIRVWGTWTNSAPGPLTFGTILAWSWQNPALAACQERGLIPDD
jgi:hypothetical protein